MAIKAPIDDLAKYIVNSLARQVESGSSQLTTAKMEEILQEWDGHTEPDVSDTEVTIKIQNPLKRYLLAEVNGIKYYEPFEKLTAKEKKKPLSEGEEWLDIPETVATLKELFLDKRANIYFSGDDDDIAEGDAIIKNIKIRKQKPSGYAKTDKLINAIININTNPEDYITEDYGEMKEKNPVVATFSSTTKNHDLLSGTKVGETIKRDYLGMQFHLRRLSPKKWEFTGNQEVIPILEEILDTIFEIKKPSNTEEDGS